MFIIKIYLNIINFFSKKDFNCVFEYINANKNFEIKY